MRHVLTLHLRFQPAITRNHGASTSPAGLINGEVAMSLGCTVPSTDYTEMKFRISLLQGLSLALWSAVKTVGQSTNDESGEYVLPEGSRMRYFSLHIGYDSHYCQLDSIMVTLQRALRSTSILFCSMARCASIRAPLESRYSNRVAHDVL